MIETPEAKIIQICENRVALLWGNKVFLERKFFLFPERDQRTKSLLMITFSAQSKYLYVSVYCCVQQLTDLSQRK